MTLFCCLSYGNGGSKKIYVIGVENIDYMPFYKGDPKEDHFRGYSRDVLDLFALSQNITFKYVSMPVKRLFYEFIEKNGVDFKYPDNPDWATDYWPNLKVNKKIFYSIPDVITKTGIAARRKDYVQSVSQCNTFGFIRGFTPQIYVKFLLEESIEILSVGSLNSLVEVLILERANCIYISKDVLKYHLEKKLNQREAVLFQEHLPYDVQSFSLSSILYPDLIEKYNQFLIDKKLEISIIRQRYGITQ
jgi:hypothetical protein